MHIEPLTTLKWAFQLHYYLCFRPHRLRPILSNSGRQGVLTAALNEICQRHEFHLLESKVDGDNVRLLISLRPADSVSAAIRILKGNSSHALAAAFDLKPPVWGRGYLAKSVGRVRKAAVKRYIDGQSEHHGYASRILPAVYRFRAEHPAILRTDHASFDLSHHLVFATRRRAGIFGSLEGK